ncbi:MAG: cobalt ECF transporter T component CbiQ [Deltaproteobacteria bacterium RBG_16_58_17]|nr:MAG: cobalt ECF transporter T component CbiQ [Deltaproteobacteria bacterium RBG_16_58_17]OHE18715.1 MAG: cobalt ECF transporter T component CbiQ [Syntrophobacterales bacterium GWC2_56_13]
MFDLFSDIFTYRDNALTRIDPRVKLVVAFAALIAVVTAEMVILPLFVLGICLATVAALRIPAKLVVARLAAPLSIVAVLVVIQTFVTGTTPLFTVTLAGWQFTAKAEGLRQGTLLGAHVLGAVSVVFLLSVVTPAHRIFQALRWFKISRNWLEVAILMYRYIFVLMDRVADLAAAQKLRLGYTARGRAMRSFTTLAGATIIHSLEQSQRTHDAMRLRGYRGTMPFGPLPAVSGRDRRILALCLIAIAAARLLEWGVSG